MKLYLTVCVFILGHFNLIGQVSNDSYLSTKDSTFSDSSQNKKQMPNLIGGVHSLVQNIKYPKKALDKKKQGRVLITCTVTSQGKVKDIKIIRSLGYGCDEEAIRLIKGAKWDPGMIGNIKTDMEVLIPLKFEIK